MNNKSFSFLIITALVISHSANAQEYQGKASLCQPVFHFGVPAFLKEIFSCPAYAQEFLPNNFCHFIELLEHSSKNKDKTYVKSVLRLFANKIKASSYINAYIFSQTLAQLPAVLEQHFMINTQKGVGSLKELIFELQYQSFKNQFPEFKSNPETFLSNLSQEIEDAAELRKLLNLFLEICLAKLVWSPEDQFQTWQNTKMIANQLAALYKQTTCDQEDLNGLCITLLERYCLFLDVAGSHLEITTFEQIRQDLPTCQCPLLELEEQEELIESKSNRLLRCLMEAEAKARAREQGMLL